MMMWLLLARLEVRAAEFESLSSALSALLGTTKAIKRSVKIEGQPIDLYLPKDGGKARAVVEKAVYPPNCTHTWAIGSKDGATVSEIRVVEMSCPHAFPCRTVAFLKQYVGKGSKSVAHLDRQVQTVAKATGSSELTTTAVRRAILAFDQYEKSTP